jgi:hypothetical protein
MIFDMGWWQRRTWDGPSVEQSTLIIFVGNQAFFRGGGCGALTLGPVTRWVRNLVWMRFEPRDGLTLADNVGGNVNLCVTGVVATKHIVTTITVRNCKLSGVYPAHYIYYTHFVRVQSLGSWGSRG